MNRLENYRESGSSLKAQLHPEMVVRLSSRLATWDYTAMAALVVITFVLFLPLTKSSYVNYDDPVYIFENPYVTKGLTWEGLSWAFATSTNGMWHPLVWISLMTEVQLFGTSATIFHLSNIWLHIASTLLVYVMARALTGRRSAAAIVAALFAWHPCHVETVAWISERKGTLSGAFWLLSILAYLRYVFTQRSSWLLAVSGFMVLGSLCKPVVVSLPIILLLMDFWPLKRIDAREPFRRSVLGKLILEKLPLIGIAAVTCFIAVYTQRIVDYLPVSYRIANACVVLVEYLIRALLPINLSVAYPRPDFWEPSVAALALGVVLLVTYLVVLLRRKFPYLMFGWCWYVVTILPMSGLVPIGPHYMADRYTYLPYCGIFLALSLACLDAARWMSLPKVLRAVPTVVVTIGILVACSSYIRAWKNSELLFGHALRVDSSNYIANINYASALEEKVLTGGAESTNASPQAAARHNLQSLAAFPTTVAACNLGKHAEKRGSLGQAMLFYERAIDIDSNDPEPHWRLARLLAARGTLRQRAPNTAVSHAEQACELTAFRNVATLDVLSQAYASVHDFHRAVTTASTALDMATLSGQTNSIEILRKRIVAYSHKSVDLDLVLQTGEAKEGGFSPYQ